MAAIVYELEQYATANDREQSLGFNATMLGET